VNVRGILVFLQDTSEVRTTTVPWTARKTVLEARLVLYQLHNILLRSPESAVHADLVFENARVESFSNQADNARVPDPVLKEADTSHGGMFRNGGKFGF